METVLTPGFEEEKTTHLPLQKEQYLLKANYLSEYTKGEKAVIRHNLGVPSKSDIVAKEDIILLILQAIDTCITTHLLLPDPHGIIPYITSLQSVYIHADGSVPFTAPQSGQPPTKKEHFTTKEYVDNLLYLHRLSDDAHPSLKLQILSNIHTVDSYSKKLTYTKKEVDKLLTSYMQRDAVNALIKEENTAIQGYVNALLLQLENALLLRVLLSELKGKNKTKEKHTDPVKENDYTTKKYVDGLFYQHLLDKNAHSTTEERKNTECYSKKETDKLIDRAFNKQLKSLTGKITTILNNIRKCAENIKEIQSNHYVSLQTVCELLEDNISVIVKELDAILDAFKVMNDRLTALEAILLK